MKTSGSPWFKHGFLNTLEHGLTRVADAATSLVLLWVLSPELFSSLALAQAMVAPALLFFISPETVLYRDFAKWREEGTNAVAARLHAFGRFAVGKGQFAFVLALVLAFVPTAATYLDCLCALIWAFALALAPQLSGPEREFLRLSLRLKTLNLISLTQKCFLLGGTVGVVLIFGSTTKVLPALALVATLAAVGPLGWARREVRKMLPCDGVRKEATLKIVAESVRSFSIWNHVLGVLFGWVQTMDLFCLGLASSATGISARELGLYGAVLKIANFAVALPTALGNLFNVWVGRSLSKGWHAEHRMVARFTGWLFVANVAQIFILAMVSPWALDMLSHGRWSADEQARMLSWLSWILGGVLAMTSGYLYLYWQMLRGDIYRVLTRVTIPWAALSFIAYGVAAKMYGLDNVAMMNVVVAGIHVALLAGYVVVTRPRTGGVS